MNPDQLNDLLTDLDEKISGKDNETRLARQEGRALIKAIRAVLVHAEDIAEELRRRIGDLERERGDRIL